MLSLDRTRNPSYVNHYPLNVGERITHRPLHPSHCLSVDCLLVFSSHDRYHSEDIFLHETGHAIDNVCAKVVIPGYLAAKKDAYDYAKRTGLWNNTYSIRNSGEYFVRMRKILSEFPCDFLSAYLSVCLSLCMTVCLSAGLICLSVLILFPYSFLFTHLPVRLPVCL